MPARLLWGLALAFCALASCGRNAAPPTAADSSLQPASDRRPVAITNATIVDVISGNRSTATIVATDGNIVAIGGADVIPADAVRVDGTGKFLVPGLWDMHAHLELTGSGSLDLLVANGVTGVRDMGSDPDYILPLRDRIKRGVTPGPEIVAAGPILDSLRPAGPLPPERPIYALMRKRVTSADEARAAVAELHARGVDFFKVHDSTPRDAFFVIAEESRKLGVPFAGHVPGDVSVEEAAKAGIRSIEHLANFRVFTECSANPPQQRVEGGSQQVACEVRFKELAARGVWQSPTMAFMQAIPSLFKGEPLPHGEYASDSLLEGTRANAEFSKFDDAASAAFTANNQAGLEAIRRLVASGNGVLAACDGLVPGFCIHDEMQWMTRAGLTPLQALQTATINPARYLRREDSHGSIAVGKRADLVLLEGDPSIDIGNTRRIVAVVLHGRLLQRQDLDRLLSAHRR